MGDRRGAADGFYVPDRLLFVIEYPALPLAGTPLLTEVTARLAHLCDGAAMPPLDEVQLIGKETIHAFVAVAGDFLSPLAGGWPVLPDGPPIDYSQPITDEKSRFKMRDFLRAAESKPVRLLSLDALEHGQETQHS